MKNSNKQYGQDLKKSYEKLQQSLANVEKSILKRFDMIVDKYPQYISDEHKQLLVNTMATDISFKQKLDIVIQAEANYVAATSNQGELFA